MFEYLPGLQVSPVWASFHLYTSGEHDRLLVEGLAPWLSRRISEGGIEAFFFLRYYSDGPHIRLRLKRPDADQTAGWGEEIRSGLEDIVRRTAPPRPDVPFTWANPGLDGRVLPIAYVPESDRFGKGRAMTLSEELFAHSSGLALKAIVASPDRARRHGVAADLTIAAIAGGCPDEYQAARFLKAYAAAVDDASVDSSASPYPSIAGGPLPASRRQPKDWALPWQRIVARYLATIESARGGMTADQRFRLLASHIHLTNNRLGLDIGEEQRLALVLQDWAPAETAS